MRRVALRDEATVTFCDEVKEDTARVGEVERARTGAPEMKAIVLVCWLQFEMSSSRFGRRSAFG